METTIRKFGNSKGAIIPAALLKELNLDVNDKVDAKAVDGCIVIEAISKSEYSLSELLSQCGQNSMRLNKEDKAWLDSPAVGIEEI
jgi:antitoxin component of MazEF toxin-antitoxin module